MQSSQLLSLIAVIAVLLLAFGREAGARRSILVILAVLIVCGCTSGLGTVAGVGAIPYAAGYGAGLNTAYDDGF